MFKFTRREIITIILLFSLVYLFESFRFSELHQNNLEANKISGGKEIPTDEAYQLIGNYRNLHHSENDKSIYKTTGWQINKKAIDHIFKNRNLKSLNFDLVEQEGTLKLILQGSQSDVSEIETGVGNSIFIVQSFCPSDCSSLNK